MSAVVLATTIAFMAYSLALTGIYLSLTVLAGREVRDYVLARRGLPMEDLFSSPLTPPVSVLVPAYNEEAGVVESVNALMGLRYPEFEVVVINDGSKDGTLERLVEAFGLEPIDPAHPSPLETRPVRGIYHSPEFPGLMVIDKENGGKSDALNAGINAARYPLICSIDGDSILEPDALLKVVEPMVARPDRVVATGGIVRVANGSRFQRGSLIEARLPDRILPRLQVVEYLRSFLVGRTGWSRINALLIVSGAFGVFRRDVVIQVGGYAHTIGEDAELIVRMHRHMVERGRPYSITFVSDPVCWTEAPESLRVLKRQRIRWQRGLLETLSKHRRMLFNPRYGNLGMLAMPYFLGFELLGPIVEALGIPLMIIFAVLGYVDWWVALMLIAISVGVGLLLSFTALLFEELSFHRYPRMKALLVLTGVSFLENFGYRQLIAFWRVQGLVQAARKPAKWGSMTRTGAAADSAGTLTLKAQGGRLDGLRAAIASTMTMRAQLAAAGTGDAGTEAEAAIAAAEISAALGQAGDTPFIEPSIERAPHDDLPPVPQARLAPVPARARAARPSGPRRRARASGPVLRRSTAGPARRPRVGPVGIPVTAAPTAGVDPAAAGEMVLALREAAVALREAAATVASPPPEAPMPVVMPEPVAAPPPPPAAPVPAPAPRPGPPVPRYGRGPVRRVSGHRRPGRPVRLPVPAVAPLPAPPPVVLAHAEVAATVDAPPARPPAARYRPGPVRTVSGRRGPGRPVRLPVR